MGPSVPRVCAHRGGAGLAPENTLAACRRAVASGVRWLEVDVRFTADRIPVLLHDPTVDRTTDGQGLLREIPFARLRALDAGGWFGEAYRGEPVPSLEELLRFLAFWPEVGVYLEIKEGGEEGGDLAEAVLACVARWGMTGRVRLASFSPDPLVRARRACPQVPLVALQEPQESSDPVRFTRERGAQIWGPHFLMLTEEALQAAHGEGVGVFVWTVNDPEDALRLLHMGLGAHPEDVVVTDFPDRILECLRLVRSAGGNL